MARAVQSSSNEIRPRIFHEAPMRKAASTNRQEIYSDMQQLANTPLFRRAALFRKAGGTLTPPHEECRWDYDASRWWASLHGMTAHGVSRTDAIRAWLYAARQSLRADQSRRATDDRPDCPYNGQAPL